MRRFYTAPENFIDGRVLLDEDETRHLRDVLRLKSGDDAAVFDGEGREYKCTVREINKRNSFLAVIEEIAPASRESSLELTIAATILNGDKYELIIQKAVELGVTTLIPLHTIRCDVRSKDAEKRLDRWRRIALEATKQTGRAKIMKIASPCEFSSLIAKPRDGTTVLFSEREGGNFALIEPAAKMTALYGPKGGWDDKELSLAREAGAAVVTLGGRILRAETASIAITAILQHRFGDLI